MDYNTKKSNSVKVAGTIFALFVIGVLSNHQGTVDAWIINYCMAFLGGSVSWWLQRYNWKIRRQIKREAVEELVERNVITGFQSIDVILEKYIRRP